MEQLAYLLQDISEEERQEALDYYEGYFEEAGESEEEQVTARLGSPEKVAAEIKAGILESGAANGVCDSGEYTEHGYEDRRFREDDKALDAWGTFEKEDGVDEKTHDFQQWWDRQSTIMRVVWLGLFLFVLFSAAKFVFGTVFDLIGGIFGVIGTIISVAVGLFAGVFGITFALLGAGIGMIGAGVAKFFVHPASGLLYCGLGCLGTAAGILMIFVCVWLCKTVVPAVVRWIVRVIRRIFSGRRRRD